jgi:hypothetical protein
MLLSLFCTQAGLNLQEYAKSAVQLLTRSKLEHQRGLSYLANIPRLFVQSQDRHFLVNALVLFRFFYVAYLLNHRERTSFANS